MSDELEQIKETKQEYDLFCKKRELSYALWSMWKYIAQDEEWFDDFIHDQRIPYSELKALQKNDGKIRAEMISYDHGVQLWNQRKNILKQVDLIERRLVDVMVEARDKDIRFKEISKAYGVSIAGVMHFLKRKKHKFGIERIPEWE